MKIIKLFTFVLLSAVLFAGCQPDELPSIGTPRQVIKSMAGNYTLSKVTQTDNDAVKKGFPYKTMDITKFYSGLKATFNTSATGEPSTFTFTNGSGGNGVIGLTSGTWTVDNPDAPKELSFKNGTVTEKIELGAYG